MPHSYCPQSKPISIPWYGRNLRRGVSLSVSLPWQSCRIFLCQFPKRYKTRLKRYRGPNPRGFQGFGGFVPEKISILTCSNKIVPIKLFYFYLINTMPNTRKTRWPSKELRGMPQADPPPNLILWLPRSYPSSASIQDDRPGPPPPAFRPILGTGLMDVWSSTICLP